jgi:hypothetical protein
MALSNQSKWNENRSQDPLQVKNGGALGKPLMKIFGPGPSRRKFFRAIATMRLNPGICGSRRGVGQSLTKSPAFLFFQGKEMMLFLVPPFVFLD